MVKYNCPRCGYNTQNKPNIVRHLNRKNMCKPKNFDFDILKYKDDIINGKEFINCEKCNEIIYDKTHECKIEKEKDSQLTAMKELVEKLNEKLDKQETKIEELLLKNTGSNTTNINVENMNIVILPYKETDLSHLTGNDYYKALNKCVLSIPDLINRTHFNKKRPENHNIYIKNMKNDYVMVYDGKKWVVKDQTEAIDDLIRENEWRLEDWVNDGGKKYPKAMEKFKTYASKRDQKGVPEMVRKEVEMLLYNNRDIVVTTRDMVQEIK